MAIIWGGVLALMSFAMLLLDPLFGVVLFPLGSLIAGSGHVAIRRWS